MLAKQNTLFLLLSALGLLLSTSGRPMTRTALSPATNTPAAPLIAARDAAGHGNGGPGRANSDIGFDVLYALFTKGRGAGLTQETITRMVLNEAVAQTPAMALHVEQARLAVQRGDQREAFQAMRRWSAEVDRELGLGG